MKCLHPSCWGRRVLGCAQCKRIIGCCDHPDLLCDACVIQLSEELGGLGPHYDSSTDRASWLILQVPLKPNLGLVTLLESNGFNRVAGTKSLFFSRKRVPEQAAS